jgi:protein-S-isoprenylcysteine O-methyltransferase Ste14
VISTGPYAIVRHSLCATSRLYLIGTPLALGSYRGYLSLAILLPFLISRLLEEERMLVRELPGYVDYQKAVRHRLIPGIW